MESGSTLTQISCKMSMGNGLCRWSGYFSWNVWRLYDKNGSMEKWSRVKEIEGKHEENESHHFGKRSP